MYAVSYKYFCSPIYTEEGEEVPRDHHMIPGHNTKLEQSKSNVTVIHKLDPDINAKDVKVDFKFDKMTITTNRFIAEYKFVSPIAADISTFLVQKEKSGYSLVIEISKKKKGEHWDFMKFCDLDNMIASYESPKKLESNQKVSRPYDSKQSEIKSSGIKILKCPFTGMEVQVPSDFDGDPHDAMKKDNDKSNTSEKEQKSNDTEKTNEIESKPSTSITEAK